MKARQFYVERMRVARFTTQEKWNLLSPLLGLVLGVLFLVLIIGIVR